MLTPKAALAVLFLVLNSFCHGLKFKNDFDTDESIETLPFQKVDLDCQVTESPKRGLHEMYFKEAADMQKCTYLNSVFRRFVKLNSERRKKM